VQKGGGGRKGANVRTWTLLRLQRKRRGRCAGVTSLPKNRLTNGEESIEKRPMWGGTRVEKSGQPRHNQGSALASPDGFPKIEEKKRGGETEKIALNQRGGG